MSCNGCTHFTMRAGSDAVIEPAKTDLSQVGICRRYPPRTTRRQDGFLMSLFPNVHQAHSCGEYDAMVPLV